MEVALKEELRTEISRIVDLMIQAESIRESMAELKKDIKNEFGIPVATITKVATIVRKSKFRLKKKKSGKKLKSLLMLVHKQISLIEHD